jgi:hypothetical protein
MGSRARRCLEAFEHITESNNSFATGGQAYLSKSLSRNLGADTINTCINSPRGNKRSHPKSEADAVNDGMKQCLKNDEVRHAAIERSSEAACNSSELYEALRGFMPWQVRARP